MEAIQAEIISLVAIVIASLIGILTQKVTEFLKDKGVITKLENKKELTKIVIGAVQQIHTELGGNEKLNVAKSELLRLANEKGIKISEHEMDLLIESSVREMRQAVQVELSK